MKKKKIRQYVNNFLDLNNSFNTIRTDMKDTEKDFPDFFDFEVEIDIDIDGDHYVEVYAYRWETDEELETRKKRSASSKIAAKKAVITKKANLKKRELEIYKKLKKKYGDKDETK